jgi:hypothetical protein
VSLPDGSVPFGDGRRSTSKLMPVSRTLADSLALQQPPFNGVPLASAAIWATGAIRAGNDGALYIAGSGPYPHRVGPDVLVTTIAGGDLSGCATRAIVSGSAALAASSPVCGFNDLAIMPDGDVVATDQGRIVRIDAATGTIAQLNQRAGAFVPDGELIDCGSHPLVRMIDEGGHLSTVAGSGALGGTLVRTKADARSIALSCVPAGALEVNGQGNAFLAVEGGNRAVLQVDSVGQVVMLGGYDDCLSPGCSGHPSGLELDRKGNIYVPQRGEADPANLLDGTGLSYSECLQKCNDDVTVVDRGCDAATTVGTPICEVVTSTPWTFEARPVCPVIRPAAAGVKLAVHSLSALTCLTEGNPLAPKCPPWIPREECERWGWNG